LHLNERGLLDLAREVSQSRQIWASHGNALELIRPRFLVLPSRCIIHILVILRPGEIVTSTTFPTSFFVPLLLVQVVQISKLGTELDELVDRVDVQGVCANK